MLLSPMKLLSSANPELDDCSAPDHDTWTEDLAAIVLMPVESGRHRANGKHRR